MSDYTTTGVQGGKAELRCGYGYAESLERRPFGRTKENANRKRNEDYYQSISPRVVDVSKEGTELLKELDKKIAECDDPERLQALQDARKELDDALLAMHSSPPGSDNNPGDFKRHWQNNLGRIQVAINDARLVKTQKPQEGVTPMVAEPAGSDPVSYTTGAAGASKSEGAGEADSTSKSSSSDSTDATGKIGDMSPDEMINQITDNPEAVSEYLNSLSESDKNLAMTAMQQRMNEINQMFTMMTNISKAQHDTAKAAINNMRV